MYLFKSVKLNKDVHTFLCSVSNVTEINNKFTFQGTLRLFRALYFGKNVRSLKDVANLMGKRIVSYSMMHFRTVLFV